MLMEEEDRPTVVSRPAMGAASASSAGGSFEPETQIAGDAYTPFDDRLAQTRAQLQGGVSDHTIVQKPEAEIEAVAFLYCRKGLRRGTFHQLRRQRNEFGRAPDCDVVVEDKCSSAHHGALLWDKSGWKIFDFASTNGTLVNGVKLGGDEMPNPQPLSDGDVIAIGDTELVFKAI